MIGPAPVCLSCIHLDRTYEGWGFYCDAFPVANGIPIPEEIIVGGNPHTKPVEGDHGIQFEQDPEQPEPRKL